jgi:hypothetical protein
MKGGEQPEANDQSVNKTMLNSIRPRCIGEPASLWRSQERNPSRKGGAAIPRPIPGEHSEQQIGMHRVVGDRMVGSWSDMNQGSRLGKGTAFMVCKRPEELCPRGDRAFVVAKKRGNARGAKGGRKVEA